MEATATICPHCGYDFPPPDLGFESTTGRRRSSPLVRLALLFGMLTAVLGSLAAVILAVVAVFNEQWLLGIAVGLLAFFQQLALAIVFFTVLEIRDAA
jgi:hypothetical protein